MTDQRRFEVVPPDWGETHLTPEAVVAYVDGELAAGPRERAIRHLGRCADCAAEVVDQRQARSALRGAACPTLPSSLASSLRAIPTSAELPAPPAGLSIGPDGEFVTVPIARPIARPSRRSLRMRLGAGAAFSGLALGALAIGVNGASAPTPTVTSGVSPGAGAVAQLAVSPAPQEQRPPTAAPALRSAPLPTD